LKDGGLAALMEALSNMSDQQRRMLGLADQAVLESAKVAGLGMID
jgi:hypothetical protein